VGVAQRLLHQPLHEQYGNAGRAQRVRHGQHPVDQDRRQPARWLVEQEDARLGDDALRHGEDLLLAAA